MATARCVVGAVLDWAPTEEEAKYMADYIKKCLQKLMNADLEQLISSLRH